MKERIRIVILEVGDFRRESLKYRHYQYFLEETVSEWDEGLLFGSETAELRCNITSVGKLNVFWNI
jgi:hypothetical protein